MWRAFVWPIIGIGAAAVGMSCLQRDEIENRQEADGANASAVTTAFGDPLPGMTADELARFQAGKTEFANVEGVDDGLGPVFNDSSCGNCHSSPALGGGSDTLETRFGSVTNGAFDPLTSKGGSLIQVKGIGAAGGCTFNGEVIPNGATIVASRRTTPLFGLGLVDAVAESTLLALRDSETKNFPGQAPSINSVHDIKNNRTAVGRFGWKDQNPTLHQFSGDAYVNEMGITSPEFPDDNCPQGDCAALARCNPATGISDADGGDVQKFLDFMTFLAPPPPVPLTASAAHGQTLFTSLGCNHCHTPTLTTATNASKALSNITFHPYSDFLLHDMSSMADGITQDGATGTLMRTAPLWGLRAVTSYLHDGSAKTVEQAILNHLGQGAAARNAFANSSFSDRQDVVNFLNSL